MPCAPFGGQRHGLLRAADRRRRRLDRVRARRPRLPDLDRLLVGRRRPRCRRSCSRRRIKKVMLKTEGGHIGHPRRHARHRRHHARDVRPARRSSLNALGHRDHNGKGATIKLHRPAGVGQQRRAGRDLMPGFVLHLGATVLCRTAARRSRRRRTRASASAASRSSTQPAPYVVAGCPFVAAGRRAVRDGAVGRSARDAGPRRRAAACSCRTASPSARPTGTRRSRSCVTQVAGEGDA